MKRSIVTYVTEKNDKYQSWGLFKAEIGFKEYQIVFNVNACMPIAFTKAYQNNCFI